MNLKQITVFSGGSLELGLKTPKSQGKNFQKWKKMPEPNSRQRLNRTVVLVKQQQSKEKGTKENKQQGLREELDKAWTPSRIMTCCNHSY